ncbi:potassium channel family protein [Microbulbifer sp. JMSA002]|uniref:potassium channel family protein n=1 Tax=Microbulbifer sp. JMSA002 TaxID=3243368 RepID=UPI00403A1333
MQRFRSVLPWLLPLLAYFLAIITFAAFYKNCDLCLSDEEMKWGKSFYFSIVTITTLGYGDITPKNEVGYFLTSFETLLGIAIFGWLLHKYTTYHSDRQEKIKQENRAEQLKISYLYFREHVSAYCTEAIKAATKNSNNIPEAYDMQSFRGYLGVSNHSNFKVLFQALKDTPKLRLMITREYKIFTKQIELACLTINLHDKELLDFFYRHICQSERPEGAGAVTSMESEKQDRISEEMSKILFNILIAIMTGIEESGEVHSHDVFLTHISSLKSQIWKN